MNTVINQEQLDLSTAIMAGEVTRFLATGEADPLACVFPGSDTIERITGYEHCLREALISEVGRREHGRRQRQVPAVFHPVGWIRRKVKPMITGLFPAAERQVVLRVAERSIVFLTQEAVRRTIRETPFLGSAWTIANLYLNSLGAPLLGDGASPIVGMSEETKCYVSLEYFADKDPFADYVTHEVAHIFHNCKRETIGLPHSRSKEWLLDLAFAKRETFAYACETYSRVLEQAQRKVDRHSLLRQYARHSKLSDNRVDQAELLGILAEAVEARNGWKRILSRCSPPKQPAPKPALPYVAG